MIDLAMAADATPVGEAQPCSSKQRRRAIAAASVGNALEFYDFMTFAFFAIQIGHAFFPTINPFLSLMASLATFGAGFITRPIGAFVLGGYADRVGRKPAMLLSMTLMGVAITVLALTPSYATIGLAAPLIAIAARLLQGFALGGEIGSATTYMMESARLDQRGFMISWQGATQNVAAAAGAFVGLALTWVMSDAELSAYGWRIALLIGVAIVPYGLIIRRSLPETLDAPDPLPVADGGFRSYRRVLILGFIILAQGTITNYIFIYMATYGQATLHLSTAVSMAAEFGNQAIGAVTILIGGALSDRIGRRPVMIWPQVLFVISILPCFLWLTHARSASSFVGANIILSGISAALYGAFYAGLNESLPRKVRARAFALVYSVAIALFGGTTQLVVTWLLHVTRDAMSIAYYLVLVGVIGLVAMAMMSETAPARVGPAQA